MNFKEFDKAAGEFLGQAIECFVWLCYAGFIGMMGWYFVMVNPSSSAWFSVMFGGWS